MEVHFDKLAARISDAETALRKRLEALQTSSDGREEREAIEDALRGLRVLQRKRLDSRPWEQSFC